MRRQTRPFIVEVKQKRSNPKQGRSIWGDLDLSAIVAETTSGAGEGRLPKRQLIDSGIIPVDVEFGQQPRAEHLMADPNEAESVQIGAEVAAKAETNEVKKRAPRPKKAKAQPKPPAAKEAAKPMASASETPVRAKTPRKIYSDKERTQKLGQIEKSIGRGESVKSATQQAGISEQTYYQWKKTATPASESGDLKDLIALEEENKRLKGLLAERLRKENAELKKKLGLG
ncbi:MAG: transposase [Hyphomicrobiales bacterium]|nr:transposase [Hyphomicrobiales bacterium]